MHFSALQSQGITFQSRATSVYPKFILIHALHVWAALPQRQLARDPTNQNENSDSENLTASSSYNLLSQQNWLSMDGGTVKIHPNSDSITPAY